MSKKSIKKLRGTEKHLSFKERVHQGMKMKESNKIIKPLPSVQLEHVHGENCNHE